MVQRLILCLLALYLPAVGAQAAPSILCGHSLLRSQHERNALLPPPKPLSPQQLRRNRVRSSFSITGTATAPKVGDKSKFWALDFTDYDGNDRSLRHYQATAVLREITKHAYIYVEEGAPVTDRSLQRLAQVFEENIVPSQHQFFGKPWTPGIDGDPRVTLLLLRIQSPGGASDPLGLTGVTVGGYFNDEDEYPNDEKLHPFSNEREMVTLNATLDVSSALVLDVLAHEYQHLIHWHADRSEALWVNEGLSMVAGAVSGLSSGPLGPLSGAIMAYGLDYDNSLTAWGDRGQDGITSDYGAAGLFFTYLQEKFGGPETFLKIVQQPESGIEGVLAGLKEAGHSTPFAELFTRWAVANLIDDTSAGDPYGYSSPEIRSMRRSLTALNELLPDLVPRLFQPSARIRTFPAAGAATVRAHAAQYLEFTGTGTLNLSFDGAGRPFEAFVLALGFDGGYQIYPLPLDPMTRTGSLPIQGLGETVGTVYLVVTHVGEEGGQPAEFRYKASIE